MRLSVRSVQRLLAAAGYYNGAIDGDAGPMTMAGVEKVLGNHATRIPARMSKSRQLVAAAQLILDAAGFEPGVIDGYSGHNTAEAFNAWDYEKSHGKKQPSFREDYDDDPQLDLPSSQNWPRQSGVSRFYGSVGQNQARIQLPFKMKIAWNTRQRVSSFTCHEKVADAMQGIFQRTLDHYGEKRISELRLDYFGGCLNVRKMRSGSRYSMHSWGIAVDLDPSNNQLRWKRDRATFARPEYNEFWRIVENAGATSLGRARNFDWMHFQFADL